jgi:hypothetical protein
MRSCSGQSKTNYTKTGDKMPLGRRKEARDPGETCPKCKGPLIYAVFLRHGQRVSALTCTRCKVIPVGELYGDWFEVTGPLTKARL